MRDVPILQPAKNKKSFMTLQDWGKILPSWQEEFSDRFVNAEGNIVFTGRGGFEYEKEDDTKDENGNVTEKGAFVKSGFKMKIAGETPYETDLNVWMELEKSLKDSKPHQTNNAYILKDRSDTINGKVFEMPKYKHFKPIINFILGLPVGEVAQETSSEKERRIVRALSGAQERGNQDRSHSGCKKACRKDAH